MPRKLLLSFLGTNNYLDCNYFVEGQPEQIVENVKYIQEAIIKLFCDDFKEHDQVLLFLTEKADQMNYQDNGQYNRESGNLDLPNIGLKSRLEGLKQQGFHFRLKPVRIKEGFSEEDIWSIFDAIADQIEEGDEIIFDITHAFRFLPMLGVVLLNYLKTTKNISVKGIHYGAFEKLGTQGEVVKLDVKDRNAPIINLDMLLQFQSWTSAVNSFVKFGEVNELNELSQPNIKSLMAQSKGADFVTKDLRYVVDQLLILTSNLQTNRLNLLLGRDFSHFKAKLEKLPEEQIAIKPFRQILKLIEKKVTPIVTSSDLIWLESAKWCLEHKLVQQAYTQLQEGLLTYCMMELKSEIEINVRIQTIFSKYAISSDFSIIDYQSRDFVKSLLTILYQKSQEKLKKNTEYYLVELADVFLDTNFEKLGTLYAHITEPRNDINHAGMRNDPMKADSLQKRIAELITQVETLLK